MLDVLLALKRSQRGVIRFEVDEPFDPISPCEAFDESLPVFVDTANQIVRHPDVQRAARTAGENVDPITHTITSCAGLTRASIVRGSGHPAKILSKRMDCRVKPGNDDFCEWSGLCSIAFASCWPRPRPNPRARRGWWRSSPAAGRGGRRAITRDWRARGILPMRSCIA